MLGSKNVREKFCNHSECFGRTFIGKSRDFFSNAGISSGGLSRLKTFLIFMYWTRKNLVLLQIGTRKVHREFKK